MNILAYVDIQNTVHNYQTNLLPLIMYYLMEQTKYGTNKI